MTCPHCQPVSDKRSDEQSVEWRIAPGYPAYEVSTGGLLRNRSTGKLAGFVGNHGYKRVTVSSRPNRHVLIHRLVAEAFLPNPEGLPFINHKDSDRANNDVRNLEWCNSSQNLVHALKAGRTKTKLSEEMVREIRSCGGTDTATAARFGVSKVMVTKIRAGKVWRHVQ